MADRVVSSWSVAERPDGSSTFNSGKRLGAQTDSWISMASTFGVFSRDDLMLSKLK
jgi:hypothetical protein